MGRIPFNKTAALVGAAVILAIDNYRAGGMIKRLRKEKEILILQNKLYTYLILNMNNDSISPEEYGREIKEHLAFLDIAIKDQ